MAFQAQDAIGSRLGRVLVVDDEEEVRRPLQRMLSGAGYEVVEARAGEEAIHLLNSGDNPLMVDAILCDIGMYRPRPSRSPVSGPEAIVYFRSRYPSVPVIVLTGFSDVELAVALMRCGVSDYLVKPISKEEVLGMIHQTVNLRWRRGQLTVVPSDPTPG